MTKFCVIWRMRTAVDNFSYLFLEFNAAITHLAWVSSEKYKTTFYWTLSLVFVGGRGVFNKTAIPTRAQEIIVK